mmetsp:Transcript_125331/g.217293  ORF Transcript_125331/g.217293 Transcript_125331/m.217293 type:complete len:168 (-) Transcript_125331:160-663(-)
MGAHENEVVEQLRHNSLTSLKLKSAWEQHIIFEALKVNSTLTQLNVDYWKPANCSDALIEVLEVNTTLTQLGLCCESTPLSQLFWFCDPNSWPQRNINSFAEALKVNNTLTQLAVRGYGIGDEGAKAFAETLNVNNTLTQLAFVHDDIGNDGAQAFAEALKVNNTLT